MFEYLIIFGVIFVAFAFLIVVFAAKKLSGDGAVHTGCGCGGHKETTRCGHCSEPIRMPTDPKQQTHSP
jgi:hypothetical protein